MWEEVESAEGARDEGRRHSRRPSAVPPHIVSLPPSSSASRAEARGPAASRAAMVEEEAVRLAGARAGSEVLGAGLRCSGRQLHCSDQTATTRVSAAASLDRGGGGWHLTANRDFLDSGVVADVNTSL
jgi:hypothetical protein